MPSKSPAQHRLMMAVAHNPEFARKVGISQSVGEDFVEHDKSMHRYAEGGRPQPGLPAIIGEQGPEMFIPDAAGTIVPNDSPLFRALMLGVKAKRPPQDPLNLAPFYGPRSDLPGQDQLAFSNSPWPPRIPRPDPWEMIPPPPPSPQFPGLTPVIPRRT